MRTNTTRVLLVTQESAEQSAIPGLLSHLGSPKFVLVGTISQKPALKRLADGDCDACIIDLPLAEAVGFLSKARGLRTPFLTLLIIVDDAAQDLKAIRAGAAGCLVRDSLTVQSLERELLLLTNRIVADQAFQAPLKKSEERYRRIVDEANEIIYRISPDGRFTFVNPTAAAVVQRTVEECINLHFLTLIRKDYAVAAAQFYRDQISQRNPLTYFEFPAVAGDGSEVWIGQNVQLVIEKGEVVELQGLGRDITARKKIEQQLLDSEQRYRSLFESNPHPMWVFDTESLSFLMVNNAAVQSYGYSLEDFLSMSIMDIRPPEERQRLADRLPKRESGTLPDPWKHLKKDGSLIDVEISVFPLIFDGKEAELVTATDVTARLRAECERQVILDITRSVNVTTNLDELLTVIHQSLKRILYAENCFVAFHDQATDLIQFKYWIDKFDPIPPPQPIGDGFTSHVLRTGRALSLTGEFKEKMYTVSGVRMSGTSSASWLGVPLRTPSGTIGVLVVQHYETEQAYTQHDIDFLSSVGGQIALAIERKRSEEALQEANRRAITDYERLLQRLTTLATSFGTARDLTTICRALHSFSLASTPCDGMFVSSYDAQREERTAIYACREGVEVSVSDLQQTQNSDSPHAQAIATNEVVIEDDLRAHIIAGAQVDAGSNMDRTLPQSSLLAPMLMKGVVIGAVEIQSMKLAAFRQHHVTAMQMAAHLAGAAIENVRLIEVEREKEEQLRQSQKMEAVGQLAGGIAHDFNNLLTAITGYSEMTLRRLDPESALWRNVEEIRKAGARAASLTRQLLAFSRKQELQPKVLDINSVVSEMDKLLRRLIGENIELSAHLTPDLRMVMVDPSQIEQVLMNLVVNARDALPDGGKITIETSNLDLDDDSTGRHAPVPSGAYVLLSVTDTGVGMDAALQERIFEPFFTTKGVDKGTGLGLSTVYGVVKQSGGNITVHSELGKGTNFKIYLPQVEATEDTELEDVVVSGASMGTETVLLVEDEQMVRHMARHILEASGYTVMEAASGREAIEMCRVHDGPVDLLLTDVVMPHISGPRLSEEIVKMRPGIPVLYMSGYTDSTVVNQGILDEGMPFLQKPFTPDALALKVRECLDKQDPLAALEFSDDIASVPQSIH
ncbi:MAG: PAS domain S-box protein [Pyrinomonadaceae bacterium]|nr:PAS domain S-box protein [Pyrinomonadaceae bacterium]